jgi:hypothetical protein
MNTLILQRVLLLSVVAALAIWGCSRMVVDLPAVENTIFVTDADHGEPINDFLLVTYYERAPEEEVVIPVHGKSREYQTYRVEIARLNSGDVFTQDALVRRERRTRKGVITRLSDVNHDVFKDGYLPAGLNSHTVAIRTRAGNPIQVELKKESPGEWRSDNRVMVYADTAIDNLAYVEPGAKHRDRLIALLERQLKSVAAAGENDEDTSSLSRSLGEMLAELEDLKAKEQKANH